MVVEPATSLKSTVTRRRVSWARSLAPSVESAAPQFRQKRARSGFVSPQLGHAAMRRSVPAAAALPDVAELGVVRSRPMRHPSTPWRVLAALCVVAPALVACLAGPSASPPLPSPSVAQEPTPSPKQTSTPTPSVTPQPTPDQTRVPIFAAGAIARTRTTVRVRDLPGTQWGVAALLPSGALVQVVLGPIRTADYGWYLVRDADGAKPSFNEGWIAAGFAPDAFVAADPSAHPPPNGPLFVAGYSGVTLGDFGPFRVEGNTAMRWAIALRIGKPAGSICRFTGTLTPAGDR